MLERNVEVYEKFSWNISSPDGPTDVHLT